MIELRDITIRSGPFSLTNVGLSIPENTYAVLMGGTALLQIGSGEVVRLVQGWVGSTAPGYAAFFLLLGALTLAAAVIYHRAPEPPTRRIN